jgi:hypothetical protein
MHSSRQLAAWLVLGREQQRKLEVPPHLSSSLMNETAALLLLLWNGLKSPPPRVLHQQAGKAAGCANRFSCQLSRVVLSIWSSLADVAYSLYTADPEITVCCYSHCLASYACPPPPASPAGCSACLFIFRSMPGLCLFIGPLQARPCWPRPWQLRVTASLLTSLPQPS